MAIRLADRLRAARHARFVGRSRELALFREALTAEELPFHLLYIHGPGGMGKTALLHEFAYLCEQTGCADLYVDTQHIDPSPVGFCAALVDALAIAIPNSLAGDPAATSAFSDYRLSAGETNAPPVRTDKNGPHAMANLKGPHAMVNLNGLHAMVNLNGLHAMMNLIVTALSRIPHRQVLLIDDFPEHPALESWLRLAFLPLLPATTLVVLATRVPPGLAWRADPGWQSLVVTLPLRNLTSDETQTYLVRRDIPPHRRVELQQFTYGYPLALSLIADLYGQRDAVNFHPNQALDVVKTVLEQFLRKIPGPAHRVALEIAAMAHVVTERMLAEVMLLPDASNSIDVDSAPPVNGPHATSDINSSHAMSDMFEWLRGLSFVEFKADGLALHEMVRELLLTDLRWRNPAWYGELLHRCQRYYLTDLHRGPPDTQHRRLQDYIYLHRNNPVLRPYFVWQPTNALLADSMQEADEPWLDATVSHFEGAEATRQAAHWRRVQPDGVVILRDASLSPRGMFIMVNLEQTTSADWEADPLVVDIWRYIQRHAPLRQGERAILYRFWMAQDTYQSTSAVQSAVFVQAVQRYITMRGLAWSFFVCANPDFWEPLCTYTDMHRVTELDFVTHGQTYGVFGHDWRVMPPANWLALMAERERRPDALAEMPVQPAPLLLLSWPEFQVALRAALSDLRIHALQSNPLLRARFVNRRAPPDADTQTRAGILLEAIHAAASAMQSSPASLKYYRAIYHTYLQPAPTQQVAADLLGVPFSSYRRHLRAGLTWMAEFLWQAEIGEA